MSCTPHWALRASNFSSPREKRSEPTQVMIPWSSLKVHISEFAVWVYSGRRFANGYHSEIY